jgi:ribosomal protein L14
MSKTKNSKFYKAAIYLRLSKEDDSKGDGSFKSESNSITNQRMLIQNFLKGVSDISPVMEFVDDGYSGSNFDRPDFQKMIKAIKADKVNCVIVKDFSRFGRDFIGSGQYMSKLFPELGIRFISINDNYDSLTADMSETSLIMPVKNLINDSYSRDISVKVRTNQQIKRINGEYIGSFTPFGYLKNPKNKNKLVVDDKAAITVNEIFAMKLNGFSAMAIADKLNAMGVLSPYEYKKSIGINCSSGFKKNVKAKWCAASIFRILTSEIYIGNLLQSKTEKVNYKVKKIVKRPKGEWVRCDNNHVAIISKADFDAVQLLLKRDTRSLNKDNSPYMFSGMIFCGDCGKSMVRRLNRYKNKEITYYICSSYNRSKTCTRHSIKEEVLKEIIFNQLERHIKTMVNVQEFASRIKDVNVDYEQVLFYDVEVDKMKKEQKKLLIMKSSLSTDLRDEIINEEQYQKYLKIYDDKFQKLNKKVKNQEQLIKDIYENGAQAEARLKRFKKFLNIEKLDRMALVTFVDRVLIFDDKTIHIIFKYKNELEKSIKMCESAKSEMEVVLDGKNFS